MPQGKVRDFKIHRETKNEFYEDNFTYCCSDIPLSPFGHSQGTRHGN